MFKRKAPPSVEELLSHPDFSSAILYRALRDTGIREQDLDPVWSEALRLQSHEAARAGAW